MAVNLEVIVEEVRKGFPELENVEIGVQYVRGLDAYFETTRNSRYDYSIDVHRSLKKAKKRVVVGGIAHEFGHILEEVGMGAGMCSFDEFLYNSNFLGYQTYDERKTDIVVVQRGFGKQLLSFVKWANKRREKYTEEDGLTAKELKEILSKLKIK